MSFEPRRFGRWILPATVLSMAVMGIALLASMELADDGWPDAGVQPLPLARGPSPRTSDPRASTSPQEPVSRVRFDPRVEERRALSGQILRPLPPAQDRSAPPTGPHAATPLVARLAAAKGFQQQSAVLDAVVAKGVEAASRELSDLLERDLPGTPYQSANLRLAVLTRLGKLDDPLAERTLVRHLGPDVPRPERLLSMSLLATGPHPRPLEIETIASSDHDRVVQAKARRILGIE